MIIDSIAFQPIVSSSYRARIKVLSIGSTIGAKSLISSLFYIEVKKEEVALRAATLTLMSGSFKFVEKMFANS